MVRINIIPPKQLSDQHLIAEYNEILMLISYIKKYPKIQNIPKQYTLGKGHMIFFKNKLLYIKQRHETIKQEMQKRGFKPTKTINLNSFQNQNKGNWTPQTNDFKIIQKRLIEKIKLKPNYYRYYKQNKSLSFFVKLLSKP